MPLHPIPRSIVVFQPGRLGDTILTTPLFAGLRRWAPDAHITVLSSPDTAIIPTVHPAVDETIALPRGLRRYPALARTLLARQWDLAIDPKDHPSGTSRIVARTIRTNRLVTHPGNAPLRGDLLTLPEAAEPRHYVDRMLAPLQLLAPALKVERIPWYPIPAEAYRAVEQQLPAPERPTVAVNISVGRADPHRTWPRERWHELIERLLERVNVAVLSSPSDRALADSICPTRRNARVVETRSIVEATAVLDRVRAVVTPDTAIVHAAAVVNTPTLVLAPIGDENARSFAPLATHSTVVMQRAGESFAEITVERVLEAGERLLT